MADPRQQQDAARAGLPFTGARETPATLVSRGRERAFAEIAADVEKLGGRLRQRFGAYDTAALLDEAAAALFEAEERLGAE